MACFGGYIGWGGWGRGGLHGVVAKPDVCFRPTSLREWPENGGGVKGEAKYIPGFGGILAVLGVQIARLYTLPLTAQTRQK